MNDTTNTINRPPAINGLQISDEDWASTPPTVQACLLYLIQENAQLLKRIEALEAKLNENSSNSNKPSSTDSPYQDKAPRGDVDPKPPRKRGKGHRQQFLAPTKTHEVTPGACQCGCQAFEHLQPYYTQKRHLIAENPRELRVCSQFLLDFTCYQIASLLPVTS